MGNQLAGVSTELNCIADLQEGLVQKSELGGGKGRLLKGLHCDSKDAECVVKVYIRRDQSENSELEKAHKQLKAVEAKLTTHIQRATVSGKRVTNVCGYSRVQESDKAAWLTRHYFYQSLYERIVTRPFMPNIAKRWCAFQLLKAVEELHTAGVAHGDLKAENVMVSSLGWLYLVDIAPFKPTYIKHDNPADFSFYFDATEQHHCYLAPERFYDPKEETPDFDAPVTEKMDLFAAGCIIAQLFLDGDVLFNLPDLLAYRKGTLDPFQLLDARIEDPDVKQLLRHILQMDPTKRFTAKEYIRQWTPKVFSHYFEMFFTNIIGCGLINCNPDERMYILYSRFDDIVEAIHNTRLPSPSKADCCEPADGPEQDVQDGLTLLTQILTASIRHCKLSESKVLGLRVVNRMAKYVADDTCLQWLLPHTVAMLSDIAPVVRAKAVQTIAFVVSRVQSFPPSEAALFEEYIMPALSRIPRDASEHVRAMYASTLPQIAFHAWRFLETRQCINRSSHTTSVDGVAAKGGYDADAAELQDLFQNVVQDLQRPGGEIKRSVLVCRSLLHGITKLCTIYGIARTNDFLLPMLTTFLNSRDSQFRCMLYRQLVGVACYVGPTSLHNFILPCMEQGLNDMEEYVVAEAVNGLANLCLVGMYSRDSIVSISKQVAPLLLHPNAWIRKAALDFITAAAQLPEVDVLCHLMPILRPFLKYPIVTISRSSLMPCLLSTVSRHGFDRAMRTATSNDKSGGFPRQRSASLTTTGRGSLAPGVRCDTDTSSSIVPDASRTFQQSSTASPGGSSPDLWDDQSLGGDAPKTVDSNAKSDKSPLSTPLLADIDFSFPLETTTTLDSRGLVSDKGDDVKSQLMHDYIARTAACIASKKREWGGTSLGPPGGDAVGQQHDLSEYKNATMLTILRQPASQPHELLEEQVDPVTQAISQLENTRNYELTSASIIVKPTSRQMNRLALQSLHPSLPRTTSAVLEGTEVTLQRRSVSPEPFSAGHDAMMEDQPVLWQHAEANVGHSFNAVSPTLPLPISAGSSSSSTSVAAAAAVAAAADKAFSPMGTPAALPTQQSSFLNSVRPSSPLLCQAKEHDGAVLDSASHEQLPIFLTAGADGTLRLWDLRQLDNESALVSRKVYPVQNTPQRKILSCCMQSAAAFAAAAGNDEGAFSLFDLNTGTELYHQAIGSGVGGGISCIRRVTACDTFMCASYSGVVCAVDSRVAKGEVWSSAPQTRHGPLTSLVLGDEQGKGYAVWMVTATLRGYVTLWDLRFRIPVFTLQYPQENAVVYALSLCGSAPTVLMAANNNEVSRWNLESLRCQTVFKASPSCVGGTESREGRRASPVPSSGFTGQFCAPPTTAASPTHSIRAICGFRECNWFITGGTDRKIRFWDSSNPGHSYTVSGLDPGEPQPKFTESRVQSMTEVREQPMQMGDDDLRKSRGHHATSTLNRNVTAHKDCITSLALVCPMPQTNIPLLVSSSRDGMVKIWQNRVMQVQDKR
eukprot:GGOE01001600.1.p1 GENE.GGOE01001600.1~~GGOE01001600.1.p1  ORF type:complete len:1493 (+),score=277.55 GGOE01001600.1:57-4535(+)